MFRYLFRYSYIYNRSMHVRRSFSSNINSNLILSNNICYFIDGDQYSRKKIKKLHNEIKLNDQIIVVSNSYFKKFDDNKSNIIEFYKGIINI